MNGHFSCVDDMPDGAFATPRLTISTSMESPTLSKSADFRPSIIVKYERRDASNSSSDGKILIEPIGVNLAAINQKLSSAEEAGYDALSDAFDEIYKIYDGQSNY